jgi:hypothetical protein
MKFVLILLFALPAFAQAGLPDHGSVADLKGLKKVHVIAGAEDLKRVKKELAKHYELVADTAEAEFVLEYHAPSHAKNDTHKLHGELHKLDAYFYRLNKRVIAWSESRFDGAFSSAVVTLTKDFLKAVSH